MVLKQIIQETSLSVIAKGTKGYTGFLPREKWNAYKASLGKHMATNLGYEFIPEEELENDMINVKDNPINKAPVNDKDISK